MLAERGSLPRRVFRDLEGSLFGVTSNGAELRLIGSQSQASESGYPEEDNNDEAIDKSPQVITMRNGLRVGIGATSRASIPRHYHPKAEEQLEKQWGGHWKNKEA